MIKKEIHIFLTAIMFFTRIPCPSWVHHQKEYQKKSIRYFSLIGGIIGGLSAAVFYASSFVFSKEISIILAMITSIYSTGAFHEDGFADVCDGLGGGWNKKKILEIMKDSRIGTYGSIGIVSILALKFYALHAIDIAYIPLVLVSGHMLSRFIATTLMYTLPYAREEESSKVKTTATDISISSLLINGFIGIFPLFLFQNLWLFISILTMYISKMYLAKKFKKWIGGQTGDCAGAVQQVSEVIYYLTIISIWKFM
ncbi:adenosylcobinamide-GDP ribazoletransferase [Aquimarina hainanensis]|uniref:Adenosylcobinamide-GDP ribazoletransferase n=1 Tax=Aquimarina hainanensis TaxID=1578017 RepID=A0ABW5NC27_9FLAO